MFYPKILIFYRLSFAPFFAYSDPPALILPYWSQPLQGIVKLEWSSSSETENLIFELQQSSKSDFNTLKLGNRYFCIHFYCYSNFKRK